MSWCRPLALLLTAVALGGCLSEIPTKPGATEADLKRDFRECQALATEKAPRQLNAETGQLEPDAYTIARDQRRCMQARGWHYPPVW